MPPWAFPPQKVLKVVSHDVINTKLNGSNISPQILGSIDYNNRITTEINKAINMNGYYTFLTSKYSYLSHSNCYWTNSAYGANNGFAFIRQDETLTKIYPKDKTEECRVIPVITASKVNLNG